MVMRSKKDAESAARSVLESKIALAGAIGQAWEDVAKAEQSIAEAQAAKQAAEDAVRSAYQAARDGGWSVDELKAMGYEAPRRRRRSAATAGD